MDNNREFLNSFNNIEDYLKAEAKTTNNSSFHYLLLHVSKDNKVVAHYESELDTFKELRNFVVHGNIDEPLVIVSESTVNRIKDIEGAIITPKKIREVFPEKVVAVKQDQSLTDVLQIIKTKHYSQFPVINKDEFNGLITDNGIIKWLAKNIDKDIISIKETCVRDVMIDDEEVDSYTFLYAYSTLYDVIREFENVRTSSKRNYVIIVLNRKTDKVLLDDIYTILTPWDLNEVYKSLGVEN